MFDSARFNSLPFIGLFLLPVLISSCTSLFQRPSVDRILAEGEEIPFEVCSTSRSWQRPSSEEQYEKWWSNARYSGLSQDTLDFFWENDFFFLYGSASANYDILNLSGLWTLPTDVQVGCLDSVVHESVLKLDEVELWVLDHQVNVIKAIKDDYAIQMIASPGTVQFVHFPRTTKRKPIFVHFVDEGGHPIAAINERETLLWPYPDIEGN